MFIRPHAQFIINSMKENPEDWTFTQYYCTNSKININLWVSSGAMWIDTYPNTQAFNFFEKMAIHKLKGKTMVVGNYRRSLKKNKVENNG